MGRNPAWVNRTSQNKALQLSKSETIIKTGDILYLIPGHDYPFELKIATNSEDKNKNKKLKRRRSLLIIPDTEKDEENPVKKIKRSDTEIIDIEMLENSEINSEIAKITEITKCTKEIAEFYYDNSGGNVELAINKIMNEMNTHNNIQNENLKNNSNVFKLNSIKGFNESKNTNSIKITDIIQVRK